MTAPTTSRRRLLAATTLLSVLLVGSACGTRASEADRLAARGQIVGTAPAGPAGDGRDGPAASGSDSSASGVGGAPVGGSAGGNVDGSSVSSASSAGSAVTATTAGGAGASAAPVGRTSASAAVPAAGAGRASSAATPAGGTAASASAPGANAGPTASSPPAPGAPAPSAPVPAAPGSKSPITIGTITHLSGPAASGTQPALDGLQLWVKDVNDRGGVNGHPVKLLVADDNSDNARHRQLTQEMVEQKGVIAFVQNGEALSGSASVDYNEKKGVPVINGVGGQTYYYESPVYFPITAQGEEFVRASMFNAADYAKQLGVKKYGLVTCTEAQVCADTDKIAGNEANVKAAGMELVYKAKTSLVQPDFTAECVGARNAGVEILQVALDGNAVGRVASSCARQNYRPKISVFGAIAFDKMKDNADLDGMTTNANGFPYFLCDGVAVDFCAAARKYGPVKIYGLGNSIGWTAGKAFERATQNLPDNPTSADILKGMWSFQNETLGGLTHPLTFTEGQNAPRLTCWWPLVLTKGQWTAPRGMDVQCR